MINHVAILVPQNVYFYQRNDQFSQKLFSECWFGYFVLLPARVLSILNTTNWYIFLFHKVKFTSKVSNDFRTCGTAGPFFGYRKFKLLKCNGALL